MLLGHCVGMWRHVPRHQPHPPEQSSPPPPAPPVCHRDYVKKIAVYKDKLAVQLQNKVVIYELANADDFDMHYQVCVCVWGGLRWGARSGGRG